MTDSRRCGRRGFTLVELLVAMAILTLVTGWFLGFAGGGSGASLRSAERMFIGLVRAARGQAVLNGVRTRLIVHNDPADPEKWGRLLGIVRESAPGSGEWIAGVEGVQLPRPIRFDPEQSRRLSGQNGRAAGSMRLKYPPRSPQAEGRGEAFLYYGFDPDGTARDANAWIVLRGEGPDERVCVAFILRRAGTVTPVREAEAILPLDANER